MFQIPVELIAEQVEIVINLFCKLLNDKVEYFVNLDAQNIHFPLFQIVEYNEKIQKLQEAIALLNVNEFEQVEACVCYSIRNDKYKDNRVFITFSIAGFRFSIAQYNNEIENNTSSQEISVSWRGAYYPIVSYGTFNGSGPKYPLIPEVNKLVSEIIADNKVDLKTFFKAVFGDASNGTEFVVSRTMFPVVN